MKSAMTTLPGAPPTQDAGSYLYSGSFAFPSRLCAFAIQDTDVQ